MSSQEVVFTTIELAIDEVRLRMLRALNPGGRTVTSTVTGQDYPMPSLGGEKLEVVFVHMPNDPRVQEQICARLTVILAEPQTSYGGLPLFQLDDVKIDNGIVTVTEKWD